MNVQGRRGRISCDNKGERLIHKKKKRSGWWRAQPLSSSNSHRAVTTRTRSERPQARGPEALPPLLPLLEMPRAGMGESQTRFHDRRAGRSLTLACGWGKKKKKRHPSRGGRWASPGVPLAERPEHCSPRARGLGTHACARAHKHTHTNAHTDIYTHSLARSTLPRTLPPAPAAHDSDPPPSGPDPAGRLSRAHKRVHTRSHAPWDPSGGSGTMTRRWWGDPGSRRPPRSPRPVFPSLRRVFMNENVVCK